MPRLERITPERASLYKSVRLRALADSPMAFGSTYARESLLTEEDWRTRAASLDGSKKIGFFALDEETPCGLVLCFRDEQEASHAHVISMWVAPNQRRNGMARSLLDAICNWAASWGAREMRLMVTESNAAAIAAYERYGFARTGRTQPFPNHATITEVEMSLSLPGRPRDDR